MVFDEWVGSVKKRTGMGVWKFAPLTIADNIEIT